jgi:hypothetical protein
VDGHVLLVDLTDQVLVALPEELLDAVPLAYVGAELDQCSERLVSDRIWWVVSLATSIVIARLSLALDEVHHERSFSSTYIPIRPSGPMP